MVYIKKVCDEINLIVGFKIFFLNVNMQRGRVKAECSILSLVFPDLVQHFLKLYNECSSFKAVLSTKTFSQDIAMKSLKCKRVPHCIFFVSYIL